MRIIIWGVGNIMQSHLVKKGLYKYDKITAFVDNNPILWRKSFNGIPIISPYELSSVVFDYVVICASDIKNIKKQIIEDLKIDIKKVKTFKEIEEYYTQKIINKYKNSKDDQINKFLSALKKDGLSVFGNYTPELTDYVVYRDEEGHPYIIFENKRIYFPDTYQYFKQQDDKEYILDIMHEQKKESPHLYLESEEDIPQGAVIVDAGTCEGNFAIRFVDKVSKIFLIESDPAWVECLKRTFKPFGEKIVICDKQLARYDSSTTITLDTLLYGEKVDFIKMDIEGDEIDALLGAKNILLNNSVKCSICSYHKMNDEENIRFILENLGYTTKVSNGYMFFVCDPNIFDTLDLRKGIVYAEKYNI
nr:FkbM family methyltransferase [uncultured Schaedlerella sp.]